MFAYDTLDNKEIPSNQASNFECISFEYSFPDRRASWSVDVFNGESYIRLCSKRNTSPTVVTYQIIGVEETYNKYFRRNLDILDVKQNLDLLIT